MVAAERLKPGDPLPTERELTASLGVSRNVLREGFRILEERGLIVTRQGAGRFLRELPAAAESRSGIEVERLEKASIADILEARIVLEQEVVALACTRRTAAEAQELCRLADRHRDWRDNVEFHVTIAKLSHNFVFERLVRDQMALLGQLHQRTYYPPQIAEALIGQHQDLAAAILDRNERSARLLMSGHLAATRMGVGGDQPPADMPELAAVATDTARCHTDVATPQSPKEGSE